MDLRINPEDIAKAHDAMAEEYDQMDDLWYPWLYRRIHGFVAKHLPIETPEGALALDAGCGTGLQSFLLAQAGYKVTGIDLSIGLIQVAQDKKTKFLERGYTNEPLFKSVNFNYIKAHKELINILNSKRKDKPIKSPDFICANLEKYQLGTDCFDIIVCCGSVMSFLDSYKNFIKNLSSALKPNGLLIIESEQRWNLDLLWPIFDKLTFGSLKYEQSWQQICSNIFQNPNNSVSVNYPFELKNGDLLDLPIWLFSVKELKDEFSKNSFSIVEQIGIHWFTNIIPSTILHKHYPSSFIRSLFNFLSTIDEKFSGDRPARNLGCSVAFALRKTSNIDLTSGGY